MGTNKLRIAVIGASGYTGGELLRLLSNHPEVTVTTAVSSEKSAGRPVTALFPNLASIISLDLENLAPGVVAQRADLVFSALPHTTGIESVAELLNLGKSVIDLSADYRLRHAGTYEQWYQVSHPVPDLLNEAVYGLPELHRTEIRKARLVAVPGCYPTAAILQLAPFVNHHILEPGHIIIDAKSGISGAGRGPALPYHFPEAHDSSHAYKIGRHRHIPEIEQELSRLHNQTEQSNKDNFQFGPILFTPHLIPMNRGILSTSYVKPKISDNAHDYSALVRDYYKNEPFIRVFTNIETINPNQVRGSNFCDIGITQDPRTGYLVSVAALDNLVKGAAGQAIQAMNLMMGFPEESGLKSPGLFSISRLRSSRSSILLIHSHC